MNAPLRILMISLDSTLVTRPDDDARRRHLAYAERAGQLTILVMMPRSYRPPAASVGAIHVSESLTLIPIAAAHPLLFPLAAIRQGARLLRQQPHDLIIAQDLWRTGAAGAWLRARSRVPLLAQNHSIVFHTAALSAEKSLRSRVLVAWARQTLRQTDFYRTVCDYERANAIAGGFPPERAAALPLATASARFAAPLSPDARTAVRARYGLTPQDRVVLWVGNSQRVKRTELLLDAFARLLPHQPCARLVLVGDMRAYAIDLPARAAALGVSDCVRFIDHVPHAETPQLYQMADVYAHPSRYEGGPRVVFEAGAAGLPLVAFDVPALNERIQPGVNGFLVPDGDVQALADQLARLLEDSALRHRLGAASQQIALARYDATDYPDRWVGLWREAARLGHR